MEFRREEILPGVFLTALRTDKFKTASLSLSLLTQLDAETASMNALIPNVLRRGTVRCPDLDSLAAYMDGLYGLRVEPVVRCIGEIQAPGFTPPSPRTAFCPGTTACSTRRRSCSASCCSRRTPAAGCSCQITWSASAPASPRGYAPSGTTRTPTPSSGS